MKRSSSLHDDDDDDKADDGFGSTPIVHIPHTIIIVNSSKIISYLRTFQFTERACILQSAEASKAGDVTLSNTFSIILTRIRITLVL